MTGLPYGIDRTHATTVDVGDYIVMFLRQGKVARYDANGLVTLNQRLFCFLHGS